MRDPEGKMYEEQLKSLGLFSTEKRRQETSRQLTAPHRVDMWMLISPLSDQQYDLREWNGVEEIQVASQEKFFTEGVFGHWNRHPVVMAPSLMEFKKHLENGL